MAEQESPAELLSAQPAFQMKLKPLELGVTFRQKGTDVSIPDLLTKFKLLAVFFGKPDCVVTRIFLPELQHFYEQVNLEQKDLQVLYVGVGNNEQQNAQFAKSMPWLALPLTDGRAKDLREYYKIRSVPQLVGKQSNYVVLRRNGNVLVFNGRENIQEKKEEAIVEWMQAKALSDSLADK